MRSRRNIFTLAILSCLLGFISRAMIASTDLGIYWPDEIYQSFEPAHRWLYGYGFEAWEFIEGARNWAFPFVVASFLFVFEHIGLGKPEFYTVGVKLIFAALGASCSFAVFLSSKRLGATDKASLLSSILFLLCTPAIYFAPRAMSENASAFALVFGSLFLLQKKEESTLFAPILGGTFLSLSVLFRLQSAVAVVVVAGWVLVTRRNDKQFLLVLLCTFLVGIFCYGFVDWLSWRNLPQPYFSGWFHSAVLYLKFNFIDNKAKDFGSAGAFYYLKYLFTSMPIIFIAALTLFALSARRAMLPFSVFAIFVFVHSLTPHKELRFVVPVLPFLFVATAFGIDVVFEFVQKSTWQNRAAEGFSYLLIILLPFSFLWPLNFGQLGAYPDRSKVSAYKDSDALNRLMIEAGRREDLCGLRVLSTHLAWTGGYTYFHKNVPILQNHPNPRAANYAIIATGDASHPVELKKLFDGPCEPINFDRRLP